MFLLNGEPLAIDTPFTTGDVQYPANWLRLSTPSEKAAIGITEAPDPEAYDQRFYWGPGLPKDHTQLIEQWVAQTKQTAGSLITSTDWYIVRQFESGVDAPPETLLYRQALRSACNDKEVQINATKTTDDLASYLTGADYPVWPTS